MFLTQVTRGLFEFILMVAMSGVVIWATYEMFVSANPDFHMGEEIKKGNNAVGVLMAAILFAASMILQKGLASVVTIFRVYMTTPTESGFTLWQLTLMAIGHLVISMVLALMTISITLRLFGRLSRRFNDVAPGKELQRGNVAMGIVLGSVVLVSAMYVGEGVSALSKALIPQPTIGRVQIMR
ncbi:MAG: DUF350 domain-containing protein [Elusimicrobia bacterium]|nr:DUF350 domain-containing protein [Elusimicrobiota bacterium]